MSEHTNNSLSADIPVIKIEEISTSLTNVPSQLRTSEVENVPSVKPSTPPPNDLKIGFGLTLGDLINENPLPASRVPRVSPPDVPSPDVALVTATEDMDKVEPPKPKRKSRAKSAVKPTPSKPARSRPAPPKPTTSRAAPPKPAPSRPALKRSAPSVGAQESSKRKKSKVTVNK